MGHQPQAQGLTPGLPAQALGQAPVTTPAPEPTIVAIATPAAALGAVGIVRLSGPAALAAALPLCQRDLSPDRQGAWSPKPRTAHHVRLQSGGALLDEALLLWFPAPHSYTGEEVVELQLHGSPIVLRQVVQVLLESLSAQGLSGRVAEPGEFTRRAFLNGKLDLAQAEAVADLIHAQTAQAAHLALRTLQGAFSAQLQTLSQSLQSLRALVEATLDFSDEPVMSLTEQDVLLPLDDIMRHVQSLQRAGQAGMPYREGLQVVIVGRPNVGKSSLLNAISGDERAIVSPIPGTTRDTVREHLHLDGIPIVLHDTAGLRETTEPIEREGIRRAMQAADQADVLLLVAEQPQGWTEEDQARWQALQATVTSQGPALEARHRVLVWNKSDLPAAPSNSGLEPPPGLTTLHVSAKTGEGIETLKRAMLAGLQNKAQEQATEAVFLVQQRHLQSLSEAMGHLLRAQAQTQHAWQGAPELVAEELRLAHRALMTISGEWGVEDLLGSIFSRFCIGK